MERLETNITKHVIQQVANKYDPILEEIKKQMGEQKEEMLLMKRLMGQGENISNASTRSSSEEVAKKNMTN